MDTHNNDVEVIPVVISRAERRHYSEAAKARKPHAQSAKACWLKRTLRQVKKLSSSQQPGKGKKLLHEAGLHHLSNQCS